MKRILISLFLGVFLFGVYVCMASAAKMAPGPSKDAITGKAYAGSEKCKSCHKAKYDSWKNTLHAWMVRPIAKGDF
jgi:hypothetical protein